MRGLPWSGQSRRHMTRASLARMHAAQALILTSMFIMVLELTFVVSFRSESLVTTSQWFLTSIAFILLGQDCRFLMTS